MKLNKITVLFLSLLILISFSFSGCSNNQSNTDLKEKIRAELGATIQPIEEINQTIKLLDNYDYQKVDTELATFQKSYNHFAIDMFQKTFSNKDNYISSPLSLYYALALLSNAASDTTKQEIENTMGFDNNTLNKYLYLFLKNTYDFENFSPISIANSIWINQHMNYQLNDNYKEILINYYQSDVYQEDFANKKSAVNNMNNWVSDKTNDMIKDLFNEDMVSDASSFFLVNALAFDDKWLFEFDPNKNTNETFNNLDGSSYKTEMLHSVESGYWEDANAKGITKQLRHNSYVSFILPNENISVYDYINNMKDNIFQDVKDNTIVVSNETEKSYELHHTNLVVPKFKYDTTLDLVDTLKEMGINEIFNKDKADLSKMMKENYEYLYVDTVIQKAIVDLNEEGISAYAATVIGGLGAGAPDKEIIDIYHDLILDRPFIFAIMTNDLPVFVGVVTSVDGKTLTTNNNLSISEAIGKAKVKVDDLNIRKGPSTSYDKNGKAIYNKSYNVYNIKENEGYTWYQIDKDKWIANDGNWVEYKANK